MLPLPTKFDAAQIIAALFERFFNVCPVCCWQLCLPCQYPGIVP
ncbi:MAG: hypothetical protein RLZZ502_1887 [Pseudomonadota bacterium]|jgi:hypothetical protein